MKTDPLYLECNMKDVSKTKLDKNDDYSNFSECFDEFGKNTKLYGYNYLCNPKASKLKRFFWAIFICISSCLCAILLRELWQQWSNQPILLLRLNPQPISKVLFPAVTICPEIKVKQTLYNFTKLYHKILSNDENITQEELQTFADTSLVCDNHLHTEGPKTTRSEVKNYLAEIAPSLNEIFLGCKWASTNASCDYLFTPILTNDGFCFTFNMIDKEKILTSSSYESIQDLASENSLKTTPAGSSGGLFVLLMSQQQDMDYVCRGPVEGFKVLLHQPNELPTIAHNYFRVPLRQEVLVRVKPELVTTSAYVKSYEPAHRQCFFPEERQLQLFQNYSQENCRIECVANLTLANCGCVAFHMPHKKSTHICGSGSQTCMFEVQRQLNQESQDSTKLPSCNCLSDCDSVTYHDTVSQANFNVPKVMEAFESDLSEFSGIEMARLIIFFNTQQVDTFERNISIDRAQFWALCGGILFLTVGVSVLSIAEILYFFFIHKISNLQICRNK